MRNEPVFLQAWHYRSSPYFKLETSLENFSRHYPVIPGGTFCYVTHLSVLGISIRFTETLPVVSHIISISKATWPLIPGEFSFSKRLSKLPQMGFRVWDCITVWSAKEHYDKLYRLFGGEKKKAFNYLLLSKSLRVLTWQEVGIKSLASSEMREVVVMEFHFLLVWEINWERKMTRTLVYTIYAFDKTLTQFELAKQYWFNMNKLHLALI